MRNTTSPKNPRIVIIGAGGFVFPFRLIGDILSFPALRGSHLVLMDIDRDRVQRVGDATEELISHHGFDAKVTVTTDQREALAGADFVIITFQVGGVDSYKYDVEIPRKYGIDQAVGDTLGPGGVFRFLRSVPAYEQIALDAAELCPNALFLNYANPMAMATSYLNLLGLPTVGLCHSVQGTTRMLARAIDVPYEEVNYLSAGINHQAFILRFQRGNEDLYPQLRRALNEKHQVGRSGVNLVQDQGDHSEEAAAESTYEGGNEQVRTAIMNTFGYFETESSHHASEYVPYFRKDAETILSYIPQRWDYYEICCAHDDFGELDAQLQAFKEELVPSVEYGAQIINANVTNVPAVIYGNVPNEDGVIGNLPRDAAVEVPCLVDAQGIQPTNIGKLPPQLAALNRTNINVQDLAVKAAEERSREMVFQAVAVDPLTASKLTLEQIRAMVEDLFEAHADTLPVFA